MYDTKMFTYNAATRIMVTEASDIQFEPMTIIELKSHKTGQVITCQLDEVWKDLEGDISGWRYIPADPEVCKVDQVVIFND